MQINLEKKDLINLVKGITPYYNVFNEPLVKQCGSYYGGHDISWEWDYFKLKNLSEKALYDLYKICKNSWNDTCLQKYEDEEP